MAKTIKKTTVDLINDYLKEQERPIVWLSRKSGIPNSTLYSILVHRISELTQERLDLINKALGTDFINE